MVFYTQQATLIFIHTVAKIAINHFFGNCKYIDGSTQTNHISYKIDNISNCLQQFNIHYPRLTLTWYQCPHLC